MTVLPGHVPARQVPLVDLLDRLLSRGVVVSGDILISVADVDLVRVSLRALLAAAGGELPSATEDT
jgi:hypothetical protein